MREVADWEISPFWLGERDLWFFDWLSVSVRELRISLEDIVFWLNFGTPGIASFSYLDLNPRFSPHT